MNSREKQWEEWFKQAKDKGYSKKEMKNMLKKRGYDEQQINQLFRFKSRGWRKLAYVIVLVCILIAGIWFLMKNLPELTTQKTIPTSQIIFTEMRFSNISAETLSEEERMGILESLENAFYKQCSNVSYMPSYTCFPFVIYSYISTRKQLGVPSEQAHSELSSEALDRWKDYYKEEEFNEEGFITGKGPEKGYNSVIQYYYFISLLPESEKNFWFEKVLGVSPTNNNFRFHLLRIYVDYFDVSALSQIPKEMITQEGIDNLCDINRSIESDWDICQILHYLQIKKFCEIEISNQETSIAKQELGIETQSPIFQGCKNELKKIIS